MQAKQKEAEYRQNQIGIDFVPCPSDDQIRVFITGQILSAQNFTNSEIFISYKFVLPLGWKAQIPEQINAMDLTQEQKKEYNCLQSMTQTVSPALAKNQDGGVTNKFYLCFPFDIQLLAKERAAQQQWPALHFQVFERDNWDRLYNQGCGYFNIPSTPGSYTIETKTWKPNLQNKTRVFQFFLGGLTRPKSIDAISKSEDTTELDHKGPINRSLFNTISSGSIKTRINVATQSKKVKTDERINYKVIKFSEETELVKSQFSKTHIPSQVNTGNLIGGRYTISKLNK